MDTLPAKALPHVVTALIAKRAELAGRIEHLQEELRQAVVDLDNVEATLRIFAPDLEIPDLAPRQVAPALPAMKGDTSRILLNAIHTAGRPPTTNELTEAVMKAKGLDIENAPLFRVMSKRVGACLRQLKNQRGIVRSMPGPGQQHLWQINPARAA
jgi:hypothetical protein